MSAEEQVNKAKGALNAALKQENTQVKCNEGKRHASLLIIFFFRRV